MILFRNRIVKGEPHWHSYFLCGVQGVLDRINNEASGHATKSELLGMDCLVSSSVPVSAGLSSSSALVCAAAIALAHTNSEILVSKLSLNGHRTVFADLCARSERYIGTEGGGMDQAIALLATPGKAKLIDFNPLVTHDMQLPVDATFVVANSLVKANKAASFTFNHRVIECRLAAKILAITHNIDPTTISKLIDIQRALNQSLDEIIITTKSTLHELVYSKSEVAVLLQLSEEELNKSVLLSEHNASPEFYLRQRALHVFEGMFGY